MTDAIKRMQMIAELIVFMKEKQFSNDEIKSALNAIRETYLHETLLLIFNKTGGE